MDDPPAGGAAASSDDVVVLDNPTSKQVDKASDWNASHKNQLDRAAIVFGNPMNFYTVTRFVSCDGSPLNNRLLFPPAPC